MADYPNEKMKEQKVPASKGHVGAVVGSNVEDGGKKYSGADSIGMNMGAKKKKLLPM